MKNPLDPRHIRRKILIEELFKGDFHPQKIDQEAQIILNQKDFLDAEIEKAAPEFPIEKINKVDLAILRLAFYEILTVKKEPAKVVIDEAIELAKEYGGQSSSAFVNGALDHFIKK
ncbi:MAG TPA: transcription antitermination protein NusB [Patescibacteria group bacterium]